jgi:hypothetical protein
MKSIEWWVRMKSIERWVRMKSIERWVRMKSIERWVRMKSIERWVRMKYVVFFVATLCLLFFEIYKKVFNLQGAGHSPNMLPSMVHGQIFRIITCYPLWCMVRHSVL